MRRAGRWVLAVLSPAAVAAGTIEVARVRVPEGTRLSAAVYDGQGRAVATLAALQPEEGRRSLRWDGLDACGQPAPAGTYRWRALLSGVEATELPAVGNSGRPPFGAGSASTWVADLAVDDEGNWYQAATWDEAGKAVRRYLADGTPSWSIGLNGSYGIAVDTGHVYVLMADLGGAERGQTIRRVRPDGSGFDAFPTGEGIVEGAIVVNPKAPLPAKPEGLRDYSAAQLRTITGVMGLSCDSNSLWVANYRSDRVDRFDKRTGRRLGGFAAMQPTGIEADGSGGVWVSHGGDRVTHFDAAGMPLGSVTGLDRPHALTLGGPDADLYVLEHGRCRILRHSSRTLARLEERGGPAAPGRVADDRWHWDGHIGLAVDRTAHLMLSDPQNQRVLRYAPDGRLALQIKADFAQPGPFADPVIAPSFLLSGYFQYRVDLGTGDWRFTHNWMPVERSFTRGATIRRRLDNGRDYLFVIIPDTGLAVYRLDEAANTLRRSAIAAFFWTGEDDTLDHRWKLRPWQWHDEAGDGTVQESEATFVDGLENRLNYFGWHAWVDGRGTYWFYNLASKQVECMEIRGFDRLENPLYDWRERRVAVTPVQMGEFQASLVRTAPDGTIYVCGNTPATRQHRKHGGLYHQGGYAIARFAADGTPAGLFTVPEEMVSFTVDGRFVYTGHNEGPQQWVRVWTPDGLLVAVLRPGPLNGNGGGWMDTATSLTALQVPGRDEHHVYTEEVFHSKLLHYRLRAGRRAVRTEEGTFTWGAL